MTTANLNKSEMLVINMRATAASNYIKLGNRSTLGPFKFIEYCRIVELLPVITVTSYSLYSRLRNKRRGTLINF